MIFSPSAIKDITYEYVESILKFIELEREDEGRYQIDNSESIKFYESARKRVPEFVRRLFEVLENSSLKDLVCEEDLGSLTAKCEHSCGSVLRILNAKQQTVGILEINGYISLPILKFDLFKSHINFKFYTCMINYQEDVCNPKIEIFKNKCNKNQYTVEQIQDITNAFKSECEVFNIKPTFLFKNNEYKIISGSKDYENSIRDVKLCIKIDSSSSDRFIKKSFFINRLNIEDKDFVFKSLEKEFAILNIKNIEEYKILIENVNDIKLELSNHKQRLEKYEQYINFENFLIGAFNKKKYTPKLYLKEIVNGNFCIFIIEYDFNTLEEFMQKEIQIHSYGNTPITLGAYLSNREEVIKQLSLLVY